MRYTTGVTFGRKVFGIIAVLVGFSIGPVYAEAQTQGNNAVYNSNASCSLTTSCGFSGAFIDASVFGNSNTDICTVLKGILSSRTYPPAGAVIDARGLPGTTGTSMQCTASPWAGITVPSTILLPAGTILIPKSWILPANTRLIGEGDNPSSATSVSGTTISACNSSTNPCSFADSAMIQFGSPVCPGIGGWPIHS